MNKQVTSCLEKELVHHSFIHPLGLKKMTGSDFAGALWWLNRPGHMLQCHRFESDSQPVIHITGSQSSQFSGNNTKPMFNVAESQQVMDGLFG